MPTLFDTLESALQGNGLSGALSSVTGSLTGVSSLISGTGSNPPAPIASIGASLRSLPLPNLDVSTVFGSGFSSLKGVLPANPSALTGGLTSGIDKLKGSGSDLTGKLGDSLKLIESIFQITQLDFTGSQTTAPSAQLGPPPPQPGGQPAPPPAPPAAAAAMTQVSSALDGLPSPLTVDSFLAWLQLKLTEFNFDDYGLRQIALIGDLRDYLATLLNWKKTAPADINTQVASTLAHLDAFLKSPLDPVVAPLTVSATALAPKLHSTELAQIADGIIARLGELKTPVSSGSLAGAGVSITAFVALLDQYDQVKAALQTDLAGVPALQNRLRNLPDDIEDQIALVVSSLRPTNGLAVFDHFADVLKDNAGLQKIAGDLSHFLERLNSWIEDVLSKLNFKAVTQPIEDAAAAMKSAVDGLDNVMVTVQTQIQQIFAKVDSVLALLDPATATAAVKTAVDSFKDDIAKKISALLKPALDAVTKVVDTIAAGVKTFDPNQLTAILHSAFQKITGVLSDPRLAEVRQALDDASKQLDAVSFAPFTGEVIKDLQAIADTLKGLGELPSPLDQALHSALSVLPPKLQPITDPILNEFQQIVTAGPVAVLNTVADLPKQLADKVRAFDPTSLVGTSLSDPYNKLLADMQSFKPSSLLAPVKTELKSFTDRLASNVSPGSALQGLSGPFDELSKALDRFHPDELIAPLNAKLKDVLGGITATIPLDDVFKQVDAVLQRIKSSLDTAVSMTSLLDKVGGILHAFADPKTQLDAWLALILAKLDSLGDTSAMQASLTSISTSVDSLTAVQIAAKSTAAVAPVASTLDTLNAQVRWTAVIQAARALPAASVTALPPSAQKSALQAALARLDFSQPAVGAPFVNLAALRQNITDSAAALKASLGDWDSRYTVPGTVLGDLRSLNASAANFKTWIHDAAVAEVTRPLTGVFSLVSPLAAIVDAVAGQLKKLVTDVESKVADLLAGVAALTSIRDSLKQLLDRIKNFNLNFLTDSLTTGFANLRAKLDAVNPANLGKALDAVFKEVLDSLNVDLFLPPADVAKIDADYAKLVDTLKSLDPSTIVANILRTEFEKDVLPLLDRLDMGAPLRHITDRLASLAEELKTELGKVEDAFEAMLAAVPAGASA